MSIGGQRFGGVSALGPEISAERTRLQIPRNIPLEEWCRLGGEILAVSDSSAWWIGDWLVYGQEQYRDRYRLAMKDTSLDYQTLRNYAWVAKKFKPSRRRDTLTFQHHMEVAGLPEGEQDHWLDFAQRLRWSRNELRRQIKASTAPDEASGESREVQLNLTFDKQRLSVWKKAAQEHSQDLAEWMSCVLDVAARDLGST